jgi:hypothetical protein
MPLGPTAPAGNPPFVFAAAAADFNQDGLDDLYLGRWNFQDLVLINDGKGKFTRHGEDWGIRTSLQDDLNSTGPFRKHDGTWRTQSHWPAGAKQTLTVKAGDRITVKEE